MDQIQQRATEALLSAGADQAEVRWTESEKQELNVEWGEVSLLRTTMDRSLRLVAMVDGKRATVCCNDTSDLALQQAIDETVGAARGSSADPANAIAQAGEPGSFESGATTADLDAMHDRLVEFLAWREATHPRINLRGVHFHFQRTATAVHNSNGVDLRSSVGSYTFVAVFSSRQGADVSSFNYSAWQGRALERPLCEVGSFDRLFRQSADQLHTQSVPEKFVGDVILTPDSLPSFLEPATGYLRDAALISGTSVYQDRVGEQIASPALTLRCRPLSVAAPQFITSDGYVAEDSTLIDAGVLQSYLLSLYGSNKTGLPRAVNDGRSHEVAAGATPLEEMIASVERGVLLCRFSGGRPSGNGDFSGIAKNSYYIEDGTIRAPLSETMVSGNLVAALADVAAVSQERVDFGWGHYPWVQVRGLTVS